MSDGLVAPGDDRVTALLAELGTTKDVRLAEEFLSEALGLLSDRPDTLDLKIASAALAEMRDLARRSFDEDRRVEGVIRGTGREV